MAQPAELPPTTLPPGGEAGDAPAKAADPATASVSTLEDEKVEYPGTAKLTIIVVALCLSLFLCGLVSHPRRVGIVAATDSTFLRP